MTPAGSREKCNDVKEALRFDIAAQQAGKVHGSDNPVSVIAWTDPRRNPVTLISRRKTPILLRMNRHPHRRIDHNVAVRLRIRTDIWMHRCAIS
jgi:hypothetical protein